MLNNKLDIINEYINKKLDVCSSYEENIYELLKLKNVLMNIYSDYSNQLLMEIIESNDKIKDTLKRSSTDTYLNEYSSFGNVDVFHWALIFASVLGVAPIAIQAYQALKVKVVSIDVQTRMVVR